MNLMRYEIKSSLKTSMVWIVSLVVLFALMLLGLFPLYRDAAGEVTTMLENFPPQFMAIFGVQIDKLFSYGGFYGFTFIYIGLIGAIMAAALSISVFAREKRAKCVDFLLTKPMSRQNIFVRKLLSCLAILAATNIIYILSGVIMYLAGKETAYSLGTFIVALLGLFLTQLVFMALGIAFATFSKRIRSVAGVATAFGFGAFILSAITNLFEDKNLDVIAPLKYFEPGPVFDTGGYTLKLACVAALVVVFCICASFIKFNKSDASAV